VNFVLPPRSQVGVLDPEISGEGMKVIMSDGEQALANVLPAKPVFPDLSGVKSLARYFNRRSHPVFPAWLYHPKERDRLVKNEDEAAALGVRFRPTTADERARYGVNHVWDWEEGSLWRPTPQRERVFDPTNPANGGKNFAPPPTSQMATQSAMIAELIPAVAGAVARELQAKGPTAPPGVADKDWQEFLQFKAWQKTAQAVDAVAQEAPVNALTAEAPTDDEERASWISEAERKGIKIDKRWGTQRIKDEVLKAA